MSPIKATWNGIPVIIVGSNVLPSPEQPFYTVIAWGYSEAGEPFVAGWTALDFTPEPAPVVAPAPPPEPWGDWIPNTGAIVRHRGTESQIVRRDTLRSWLWCWVWNNNGRVAGGDDIASAELAIASCEAYTASKEGAPPPAPAQHSGGVE